MSLNLSNYKIILGSTSERRQQILKDVLKIDHFEVMKPDFEENLPKTMSPEQYVSETSKEKLKSILNTINMPDQNPLVICCDTIVNCNGKILEKPQTKQNQKQMFSYYRAHPKIKVISCVQIATVVHNTPQIHHALATTTLNFDTTLSETTIQEYIDSEEGLEVAGGFKYQESGNVLFSGIEGDYFNVVGLPAKTLFDLLKSLCV